MTARDRTAAEVLIEDHRRHARFAPLAPELTPRTLAEAYAVQDAFVALKSTAWGEPAGWKIALTTPSMRALTGLDDPIAGVLHQRQILRSPARVRGADYARLIVEFEIAVELSADLLVAGEPCTRERVDSAIGAVMPAFELADDRNADYANLRARGLELIADNAWNEGAVLGAPVRDWRDLDLAALRGVAFVNGDKVGEGRGGDAMGHPSEVVAWIANNLAARGKRLAKGDVVITGSLVPSVFPGPGDRLRFDAGPLGAVELFIE
jgi:2-keto-4-pentenoate hydratase